LLVFLAQGLSMTSSMIRAAVFSLALTLLPTAAPAQEREHPDERVVPQQQEVAALPAKPEAVHPFAAVAGGWSGGGVISLTNDITERLRCRADHTFNRGASSLALNIRCASDNYKFELTSNVVERRGQITGQWKEASYGVSGSINGRVAGNRITALAQGDKFTSDISVTTTGNRQTVSLTPKATYIISVQIALNRR
jgi:hypothetical protein